MNVLKGMDCTVNVAKIPMLQGQRSVVIKDNQKVMYLYGGVRK